MRRRLLTSLVILAAAAGTSACGNKQAETLHGTTEGAYLDLGGMKYQVQISRQLNPASVEDRYYLIGLNGTDRQLPVGQEWFAVFMRVENDGDKPARAANDYVITDTQGNRYRPLSFAPLNSFAYRGGVVMQPTEILPKPDSPSGQGVHPGRAAAVQDPDAQPREPPARARRSARPPRPARSRRSTSTSSPGSRARDAETSAQGDDVAALRPAERTSRAAGAAVVPPAPEATSRTPTAMRGAPLPAGA